MKLFLIIIVLFSSSSCSYFHVNKLETLIIDSNPRGARVVDKNGVELGHTPYAYNRTSSNCDKEDTLYLAQENYYGSVVRPGCDSNENVVVNLVKKNNMHFKLDTFGTYYKEINTYTNRILQIQFLIIKGETEIAYKDLVKFLGDYPNVSSVYIMMAQIEMQKGQLELANEHLNAALKLDRDNSDAIMLLAALKQPQSNVDQALNKEIKRDKDQFKKDLKLKDMSRVKKK